MACTGVYLGIAFVTAAVCLAYVSIPLAVPANVSSMLHTAASHVFDNVTTLRPVVPTITSSVSSRRLQTPLFRLPRWCKRNQFEKKDKCFYIRAHGDEFGNQVDELAFGMALAKNCNRRLCGVILERSSQNGNQFRKQSVDVFGHCSPGILTELPKAANECNESGYCFSEGCDIPNEADSVQVMVQKGYRAHNGHYADFASHFSPEFLKEFQTVVMPQLTPMQYRLKDPRKAVVFDLRRERAEHISERYGEAHVSRYTQLIKHIKGEVIADAQIHVWVDNEATQSLVLSQWAEASSGIQVHIGENGMHVWAHLAVARILVTGINFMVIGKYVPAFLSSGCVIYDKIEGTTPTHWMDLRDYHWKLPDCIKKT